MKIIQKPNSPLIIAFMGWLGSVLFKGIVGKISHTVFFIAILIWAYLEITTGKNWFRKLLGGVVFAVIAVSLFNELR